METTTRHTVASLTKTLNNAPVGSTFHIGVNLNLPTVDENEVETGNVFPGYSIVKVGRDTAIAFAKDALRHFEERSARITLYATTSGDAMFYIVG